jgi:hypothetical protein
MRTGLALGLCALLLAAAAGCGDSGPHIDERGGMRLLVAGKSSASNLAVVAGNVTLTAGRCVGLSWGESTMLVIWLNGTKLTTDGRGIYLPGVGTVRFGESITGAGGYASPGLREQNPGGLEIPPECLKGVDDEVAYLQSEPRRGDL